MNRALRLIFCIGCIAGLLASPLLAQGVCDGVAPVQNTTLQGVEVVTGLTGRPLYVTAPPGDTDRIFIVEQDGLIWVKQRGTSPGTYSLFLDISASVETGGNEQGLLGMAFDPDYDTNGYFYVNYIRATAGNTIIARHQVSAGDPDIANVTGATIMAFGQPESNHNGGHIAFGPDGYLYIATGDGGGGGDIHGTCGNGQNTGNVLGALLRIDPHATGGTSSDCAGGSYTNPASNPLSDGAGGDCDEIWAYGLRNPWRFSFDTDNGDLYIGDVGQGCWEEIDWVPGTSTGGENYGWRQMEGAHCYNPSQGCFGTNVSCTGSPNCNDPSLTDPVVDFTSVGACSVTGGYVYRGCRMPNFEGTYFYGDYCDGSIRSFEIAGGVAINPATWQGQVDPTSSLLFGLTSFGTDAQGEIYIADRSPGSIVKMMPPYADLEVSGAGAADRFLLNRTGNWSWEDVEYSTMHPTDYYQVYRGTPDGTFECIHSTASTDWAGGDALEPASGQLLAYLVTAVDGTDETSGGTPPRTLTSPCAAP